MSIGTCHKLAIILEEHVKCPPSYTISSLLFIAFIKVQKLAKKKINDGGNSIECPSVFFSKH